MSYPGPRFYLRSGRGHMQVRDREGERHVLSISDRDQRPTPEQIQDAGNIWRARTRLTREQAQQHADALNEQHAACIDCGSSIEAWDHAEGHQLCEGCRDLARHAGDDDLPTSITDDPHYVH